MFDFDSIFDRQRFFSSKWNKYRDRDVLPFWVADMDFAVPPFLLDAIHERLKHPLLGYTDTPDQLIEAFITWASDHFGWNVHPDWLVWVHGVVPGLNIAVKALSAMHSTLLVPVPVYPPFLRLAENNDRSMRISHLVKDEGLWVMNLDEISSLATDSSMLVMCNPQNPTGRIYTEKELRSIADLCVKTNTLLLSDEIHWGITLDHEYPHIPIASLSPEIAQKSVTLISHTKVYNIAGLQVGVAVIPNPSLRRAFATTQEKLFGSISPLSYAAAQAAFEDRGPWLQELNRYLTGNRNELLAAIQSSKALKGTYVEGTHLAWIDASSIPVEHPNAYFESFGLGLSPGEDFGVDKMVRFNFATPRSLLRSGIKRLLAATENL